MKGTAAKSGATLAIDQQHPAEANPSFKQKQLPTVDTAGSVGRINRNKAELLRHRTALEAPLAVGKVYGSKGLASPSELS